jgi:Flp pilus assembly protein TadB
MDTIFIVVTFTGFAITILLGLLSFASKNLDEAKKLKNETNKVLDHCAELVELEVGNKILYIINDFLESREEITKGFKVKEEDLEELRFFADLSADLKRIPDLMSEYETRIANSISHGIKLTILVFLSSVLFVVFLLGLLQGPFFYLLLALLVAYIFVEGIDFRYATFVAPKSNLELAEILEKLKSSKNVREIEKKVNEVFRVVET